MNRGNASKRRRWRAFFVVLLLSAAARSGENAANNDRIDLGRARELARPLALPQQSASIEAKQLRRLRIDLADLRGALRDLDSESESESAREKIREKKNTYPPTHPLTASLRPGLQKRLLLLLKELRDFDPDDRAGASNRGRRKHLERLLDEALAVPEDSRGLVRLVAPIVDAEQENHR